MQLLTLHYPHNLLASSWNSTSSIESCDDCVLATPLATRLPFYTPKSLPLICKNWSVTDLKDSIGTHTTELISFWMFKVGLRSFVGFLNFDPHCFTMMLKHQWQTTAAKNALTSPFSPACFTQCRSALMRDSCRLFVKPLWVTSFIQGHQKMCLPSPNFITVCYWY